ncbi:MAG: hypothetical protein NTZ80_00305, partial [Patescibacteria group bacterium]|nr:hypothetical protein [Patescibacteria group bacterium]
MNVHFSPRWRSSKVGWKLLTTLSIIFIAMAGFFLSEKIPETQAVLTIVTAVYEDVGGDGKVDNIKITFDEDVTACAFEESDWSITEAGTIGVTDITGLTCLGTDEVLDVAITASDNITGGATAPIIAYNNDDTDNSVTLTSNPLTNTPGIAPTDGAKPIVMTKKYLDNLADGTVDRVELTLTEAFTVNTAVVG